MMSEIALCLDSESARAPELIGLDGENLLSQSWLHLWTGAAEAREQLRGNDALREVWVVSSDDMDSINLAAAIKRDDPDRIVCLVAFTGGGSLRSRATAAGVDTVFSRTVFIRRYAQQKAEQHVSHERAGCEQAAYEQAVCEQPSAQPPSGPSDIQRAKSSLRDVANISIVRPVEKPIENPIEKPVAKRNSFLIAVVGAAGGVGKSTVSGLTAYFAQGFGLRTLLVDADFQFGDMHYLAGAEHSLAIDKACSDSRLLGGLRACGSAPAVLAAPSRLEHSEEMSGAVSRILDAVHESFDVVVANTGTHWGEVQAQLLEQANLVIFLVDQRASALRKARHAIELCGRCGIPTSSFVVAVNRCSRNALINSFDASCSLGGLRAIELCDGGREVDELLGAGLPLELIASGNEFCVSLEHFLVDVLPRKEGSLLAEADELAKRPKSRRRRGRRRSAACL